MKIEFFFPLNITQDMKEVKDSDLIQSSTTSDTGHHIDMGK